MLYSEGLMHRKVNIGLALLIIVTVAGIFAWIISARAFSFTVGPGVGLGIVDVPIKCVLDPQPSATTCIASCPVCGTVPGCAGLFEIKARFLSGTDMLWYGALGPVGALCTTSPTPPNGGSFGPGKLCLGNVAGIGPHIPNNFGCSR